MKMNPFIALIPLFYLSACAGMKMPAPFPAGKVIDTVVCLADGSQSYALYIPAKRGKDTLPVVYFFDAHGAGALPVNKYKALAEAYGFILVGSNNSKNGNDWTVTDNIWRNLYADTRNRLKIDTARVYTCGFSGGAKVAGYVGTQYPVAGVIANGAASPPNDIRFPYTLVAGEGDLNLTEMVAVNHALDRSGIRHRIIYFDGKHEWAPEGTMRLAFAGLQFDAMRQGTIPENKAFIHEYTDSSRNRFETYYTSNQLIKAWEECNLSAAFMDTGWFKNKLNALSDNPVYIQQRTVQQDLLKTEQHIKEEYGQHFQQVDIPYWENTINDLRKRAGLKTAESPMCQRLLAYLSLAFYSYGQHMIGSNANKEARYFVELYKMADPANSEAWYFSAILDMREHNSTTAQSDLLKAVENGFSEPDRLKQQPEFSGLSLTEIENKMRRN